MARRTLRRVQDEGTAIKATLPMARFSAPLLAQIKARFQILFDCLPLPLLCGFFFLFPPVRGVS